MINVEIKDAIRQIRKELYLSQEAFARELHVGFTAVNRWENGHTRPNQIARHAILELCAKKNLSQELINVFIASK